jgi:transcription elongation factor GreB
MSKAFTREDDVAEETPVPLPPRAPPGQKRPITAEGFQALQQELASLPPEQTRRIQQLEAIRDSVEVFDAPESNSASFGAWVTIEDENGHEMSYRLVGPDEADARAGRLSVESPLARVLLGHSAGETVTLERPRGAVEYTITSISAKPTMH